ncbi:MAG: signal peptidase II [Fimbriimonadales bacterium]|nr:signal peptidase II [Fimbriimonadales bacterium]
MFWLIAAIVFILDQATKYWVVATLNPSQSVPIIPGVFHLTRTHNTGIAFGLMDGKGWITIPLSLIVIGGILVYLRRAKPSRFVQAMLGLLLGGAAGNLLDRLRYGYVVDMFDLLVWPVFNVADMAITAALAGLVLLQFVGSRHEPGESAAESEEASSS